MSQNRATKLRMRRQSKRKQPQRPYSQAVRDRADRLSQAAFGFPMSVGEISPLLPLLLLHHRKHR